MKEVIRKYKCIKNLTHKSQKLCPIFMIPKISYLVFKKDIIYSFKEVIHKVTSEKIYIYEDGYINYKTFHENFKSLYELRKEKIYSILNR